ncbi:cell division protein ZipA C-terminal FtsZ-binding domain-containing protein [Acinetobacter sp. ANC 4648]|uniref:cell division protein ZipA C-terminal FtsZ-binding domain-containing protein n=1 Tax=Acinetobacter sp. ANC 4648 TaxID=1977875 RepID=UPI000A34050C|nr:cell division protein ZipA C-terminal FtsZ-binding domain-containing protein [Acinetobacter sp. ANC 4648]OTG83906.1 cell division protein ZipA [Acinetobacter sp. ANC 4648]
MEITTIIGIVVAVIIILVGLRMVMRKSNDAAPSLESELHVNSDSNLPVIPRHVRDQLQSETETSANVQRVEPHLNSLASVDLAEDAKAAPKVEAEASVTQAAVATETASELASSLDTQTPSTIKQEQQNQIQAVITQEKIAPTQMGAEVKPPQADAEFNLSSNVETAEIKEFDEESSILDVHLHEQQRFDDECSLANAESLIALNVHPNPRKALSGDKTLKVLLKYGLRYGEMSCFHRYENIEEVSPLMFSVLRLTDEGPAGFDLETLSGEQVQGLAFFLALPHADVQKGFDTMVSIAGLIAREIDGTVYDENNLEFTPQLKEHWRHKAIDFRSGQEV